jgi:hypothetical protein|tara:strand:+ start:216 stop:368 length:153 start_codon:yes stop_codon:yes gene_type:complete
MKLHYYSTMLKTMAVLLVVGLLTISGCAMIKEKHESIDVETPESVEEIRG